MRGPPAGLPEQRVRQGRSGPERCRFPDPRPVAPGELPDGDENPESEGDAAFLESAVEGDGEGAGGEEGGAGVDQGAQGRRRARAHRCAPGRLETGAPGGGTRGVRASSAVTAGCQPVRRTASTRAATITGSKWLPAHRSSSSKATATGRALL